MLLHAACNQYTVHAIMLLRLLFLFNDPFSGARLSNNTNCYNTKMIDKHSGWCVCVCVSNKYFT